MPYSSFALAKTIWWRVASGTPSKLRSTLS